MEYEIYWKVKINKNGTLDVYDKTGRLVWEGISKKGFAEQIENHIMLETGEDK